MKVVSLTVLFITAPLTLSTNPGMWYIQSAAGNPCTWRADLSYTWIFNCEGVRAPNPLHCSRVNCSWYSINICWITNWIHLRWPKAKLTMTPILTPLLTVSSRSWLPFQVLALLPENQRIDRWPGWASMPGNDSSTGIPGLSRRALESFPGTRGSHISGSGWPLRLYHLVRETLQYILHTGLPLLVGLFLRVHASLHTLAHVDTPLLGAPASLFPVSVVKSQHKSHLFYEALLLFGI